MPELLAENAKTAPRERSRCHFLISVFRTRAEDYITTVLILPPAAGVGVGVLAGVAVFGATADLATLVFLW